MEKNSLEADIRLSHSQAIRVLLELQGSKFI